MDLPMKMEHPASETPTATHSTPEPSSLTPSGSIGTKMSQSPSPKSAASGHTPNNASKRPPRKSTLTQQQKNQKRQRATQDQLTTLELEFNKNPTPTATVRERIAEEINMTERSVQIWFQNRCVESSRHPSCFTDPTLLLDVPRLSSWRRRVWKAVKTLTLFLSRCVPISPCRQWSLVRASAGLTWGVLA